MAMNRSKKYALSPIQREILWTLAEAGSENIPTILNTLRLKFLNLPVSELLRQSEKAIRDLSQSGLIALTQDHEKPGLRFVPVSPDHLQRFLSIGNIVTWDEDRGWVWEETKGGIYRVSLSLTEKGRSALSK
jgi:hypothetical protein